MRQENEYLLQKAGSCCTLYALVNALIYYDKEAPEFGSQAWNILVDLIGCKYGSAISTQAAAYELGLELFKINAGDCYLYPPCILCVYTPIAHSVLVIGGSKECIRVVNYDPKVPVVADIAWKGIERTSGRVSVGLDMEGIAYQAVLVRD